jgi:hypothetical protein
MRLRVRHNMMLSRGAHIAATARAPRIMRPRLFEITAGRLCHSAPLAFVSSSHIFHAQGRAALRLLTLGLPPPPRVVAFPAFSRAVERGHAAVDDRLSALKAPARIHRLCICAHGRRSPHRYRLAGCGSAMLPHGRGGSGEALGKDAGRITDIGKIHTQRNEPAPRR